MKRYRNSLRRISRHLFSKNSSAPHPKFKRSGITEDFLVCITSSITFGSQVLEFWDGLVSTKKLSKQDELTSIEHDLRIIGKFDHIHAPLDLTYRCYKEQSLNKLEHKEFKVTIIDGLPGLRNRFGILFHLKDLKKVRIILVDDTDRPSKRILVELLSRALNTEYQHFGYFSILRNSS